MTAPPYMPLYVGDYLADTVHLGATEHGAYLMLLMCMWRIGPLPNDPAKLAKFSRCTKRQWASISGVVMSMMTIENDMVSSRRLMVERAKYAEFVNRQRNSGVASAAARALKNNNVGSTGVQPKVNQPEPEPYKKEEVLHTSKKEAPTRSARGCRIPIDWRPTDGDIAYAVQNGFTLQQAEEEADGFRTYWISRSRDAARADWSATFKTRIRDVASRRAAMAHRSPSRSNGSGVTDFASIVAERRRRAGDGMPLPEGGGILLGDRGLPVFGN